MLCLLKAYPIRDSMIRDFIPLVNGTASIKGQNITFLSTHCAKKYITFLHHLSS